MGAAIRFSFFVVLSISIFQKQGKTWRTASVSAVQEIDTGIAENGLEGKMRWK
jgi:hypothetical protein